MLGSDGGDGGDSGASDGGPSNSPTPEPDSQIRVHRWQAVTALIAAVATVVAALITGLLANGSGGETPPPKPTPPPTVVRNSVGITSFTESAALPHGKTYVFTGTAAGGHSGSAVFVIIRNPANHLSDGNEAVSGDAWLVSPKADIFEDGRWKVIWTFKKPPPRGEWTAVLVFPVGAHDSDSNPHRTYDVPALRTRGVLAYDVTAAGTMT